MSSFIELRERSALIARQFRQCRDVEAGLAMVPVIEATVGLAHDFSPSEQLELATLVKALMACQERRDWPITCSGSGLIFCSVFSWLGKMAAESVFSSR